MHGEIQKNADEGTDTPPKGWNQPDRWRPYADNIYNADETDPDPQNGPQRRRIQEVHGEDDGTRMYQHDRIGRT